MPCGRRLVRCLYGNDGIACGFLLNNVVNVFFRQGSVVRCEREPCGRRGDISDCKGVAVARLLYLLDIRGVGEELGIFGGLIVLMLYAYLLYRLFFIAQNAPDLFGSLMVSGIFIHIALQVILNIAVVVNLMQNTGVTLPFISYGGTSILFLMAEMGLALSVARQIKFES